MSGSALILFACHTAALFLAAFILILILRELRWLYCQMEFLRSQLKRLHDLGITHAHAITLLLSRFSKGEHSQK